MHTNSEKGCGWQNTKEMEKRETLNQECIITARLGGVGLEFQLLQRAQAGGWQFQGLSGLQHEFKVSLGNLEKHCLKIESEKLFRVLLSGRTAVCMMP